MPAHFDGSELLDQISEIHQRALNDSLFAHEPCCPAAEAPAAGLPIGGSIEAKPAGVLTIRRIQEICAEAFGVPLVEMRSARQARRVVRSRQAAMYLAREFTLHSLPSIGRNFGDRDHTTVMYAIWRVNELVSQDQEFATALNRARTIAMREVGG